MTDHAHYLAFHRHEAKPFALVRTSDRVDPEQWVPFTGEWLVDVRLLDALHGVNGAAVRMLSDTEVETLKEWVGAITTEECSALKVALDSSVPPRQLDDYERGAGTLWNPREDPEPGTA